MNKQISKAISKTISKTNLKTTLKTNLNTLTLLLGGMSVCLSASALAHQEHQHHQQQQEQKNMLQCQISAPDKVKLGAAIPMTFTLTNNGDHALNILRWNTPLEGWFNRYLTITKEGQQVNYQGAMVKRFRPSDEDYSLLAAGQSQQATVNLAQGYDIAAKGTYQVVYTGRLHDVKVVDGSDKNSKERTLYALQCNELTLVVE